MFIFSNKSFIDKLSIAMLALTFVMFLGKIAVAILP